VLSGASESAESVAVPVLKFKLFLYFYFRVRVRRRSDCAGSRDGPGRAATAGPGVCGRGWPGSEPRPRAGPTETKPSRATGRACRTVTMTRP
jgi:hypothetical protein